MDAVDSRPVEAEVLTPQKREESALRSLALMGVAALPLDAVGMEATIRALRDVVLKVGDVDKATLDASVAMHRALYLEEIVQMTQTRARGQRVPMMRSPG